MIITINTILSIKHLRPYATAFLPSLPLTPLNLSSLLSFPQKYSYLMSLSLSVGLSALMARMRMSISFLIIFPVSSSSPSSSSFFLSCVTHHHFLFLVTNVTYSSQLISPSVCSFKIYLCLWRPKLVLFCQQYHLIIKSTTQIKSSLTALIVTREMLPSGISSKWGKKGKRIGSSGRKNKKHITVHYSAEDWQDDDAAHTGWSSRDTNAYSM